MISGGHQYETSKESGGGGSSISSRRGQGGIVMEGTKQKTLGMKHKKRVQVDELTS